MTQLKVRISYLAVDSQQGEHWPELQYVPTKYPSTNAKSPLNSKEWAQDYTDLLLPREEMVQKEHWVFPSLTGLWYGVTKTNKAREMGPWQCYTHCKTACSQQALPCHHIQRRPSVVLSFISVIFS